MVPGGPSIGRKTVMPRIIVMSESGTEREGAITLDERVASADMRSGHHAAQLIERVGWAVHDADDTEAGSHRTIKHLTRRAKGRVTS
jgi:hypothetical protein